MPNLGVTTPYYGGGQVPNPSNVINVTGAPSNNLATTAGIIATVASNGNVYISYKKGAWTVVGGGASDVNTLTGDSGTATPSAGNIKIAGTANQITTAASGATVTLTLPAAITAPGSILATTTVASTTSMTAGTSITATLGNITATNGNLVLSAGGNKLVIHASTASTDSVGVSGNMSGNPGTVTVTTSACTVSSVILFSRATTGGTPGEVSITSQSSGSFVLTSTGNETSTFNYLIIN